MSTPYGPHGIGHIKIKLRQIFVDRTVQRSRTNEKLVKQIVGDWNPRLVGTVVVSRRSDHPATYHVVEGWHRCEAMRRLFGPDHEITAEVHTGLSRQGEADLFHALNKKHRIPADDSFRVELVAEHPTVVAANNAVLESGYYCVDPKDLDPDATTPMRNLQLRASDSVKGITENYGPEMLTTVLQVGTDAWGRDGSNFPAPVLNGVSYFLMKYPEADHGFLTKALRSQWPNGGTELTKDAMAAVRTTGSRMDRQRVIARLLVGAYNKSRRGKNKLDESTVL